MRGAAAFILLASLAQSRASEAADRTGAAQHLVEDLLGRALEGDMQFAVPFPGARLDSTTLGKASNSNLAVRAPASSNARLGSLLPVRAPPTFGQGGSYVKTRSSVPLSRSRRQITQLLPAMAEAKPCEAPSGVAPAPDLASQKGSASIIRSTIVRNADGDAVPLDAAMGPGTSVVVFLRHMG